MFLIVACWFIAAVFSAVLFGFICEAGRGE
jgi:hypothetical protein